LHGATISPVVQYASLAQTVENRSAKLILPDGSYKKDTAGKEILVAVPNVDSGIFLRGQHKSQANIWCWPVGSGEAWG
jgi:hypothetical protein